MPAKVRRTNWFAIGHPVTRSECGSLQFCGVLDRPVKPGDDNGKVGKTSRDLRDLWAGGLVHGRVARGHEPRLVIDHTDAPAALLAERDIVEPRHRAGR